MTVAIAVLAWAGIVIVSMIVVTWLATRWGRDPFGWALLAAVMGPFAVIGMLGQRRSDVQRPQPFERESGVSGASDGHIVAAVDGSAASERVARYAAANADGGDVTLVVVMPHESRPRTNAGAQDQHKRNVERQSGAAIEALRSSGVPVRVVVAYGNPGEEIVRLGQEENAGLIVVGRRGAGLSKALLGSVSDHVVKHAGRNVAVVE